jgi:hypothetical protein
MGWKSPEERPPPRFVAPPPLQNYARPGDKGTTDPFRQFKLAARDDGKPFKSPEPKVEQGLLALLAGKGALVVMGCLLVGVVAIVLALLITRV